MCACTCNLIFFLPTLSSFCQPMAMFLVDNDFFLYDIWRFTWVLMTSLYMFSQPCVSFCGSLFKFLCISHLHLSLENLFSTQSVHLAYHSYMNPQWLTDKCKSFHGSLTKFQLTENSFRLKVLRSVHSQNHMRMGAPYSHLHAYMNTSTDLKIWFMSYFVISFYTCFIKSMLHDFSSVDFQKSWRWQKPKMKFQEY